MVRTALGIVHEEGFWRLWRGMSTAIYRHAIYTGVRFGAYEQLRENVFKRNPDGTYSLWYLAPTRPANGSSFARFVLYFLFFLLQEVGVGRHDGRGAGPIHGQSDGPDQSAAAGNL